VGFALEAENPRERALQKLRAKNCDWIVLNGPTAIGSPSNHVELLGENGASVETWSGTKTHVADSLLRWLHERYSRA
jgi:phosphopantothenoylcysteine decarboxylase/phosphopantothenate--cysteine ligase